MKTGIKDLVKLGYSFKNEVGKRLVLGMSDHVIEYGNLSEGHETIGHQRYFQATREFYLRSIDYKRNEISEKRWLAKAKKAQFEINESTKEWDIETAEADLEDANLQLGIIEVDKISLEKMLRKWHSVIVEMEPEINRLYDGDVEKWEPTRWKQLAAYRARIGDRTFKNLCIPPRDKAELAFEYGRPELAAAYSIEDPKGYNKMVGLKILENKKKQEKIAKKPDVKLIKK